MQNADVERENLGAFYEEIVFLGYIMTTDDGLQKLHWIMGDKGVGTFDRLFWPWGAGRLEPILAQGTGIWTVPSSKVQIPAGVCIYQEHWTFKQWKSL